MEEALAIVAAITAILTIGLTIGYVIYGRRYYCEIDPNAYHEAPCVTVIIAARDEAAEIGATVQSLLRQRVVAELVVVDDGSVDQTATIVRQIADTDNRVIALSAPVLERGWVGKSAALQFGAQKASTEFVLFTDADVLIGDGVIATAVSLMRKDSLEHLGGYFSIRCRSAAEAICAPVLSSIATLVLFSSASTKGAATGAFNLLRTDAYRRIKGHQAIRSQIVDDVALARLAKTRCTKTAFADFSPNVRVHLFTGLSGYVACVKRSGMAYLSETPAAMSLIYSIAVFGLGAFWMMAPVLSLGFLLHHSWPPALSLFCSYGSGTAFFSCSRRYHDAHLGWVFLYPFPVMLIAAAIALGALDRIRKKNVAWRGRYYPAPS